MKNILTQISPSLRALGFKGSGQNYRKVTPDVILVVNFQKSSGGERFYVNLGVQPKCVPTEGETEANPKSLKEYECIFRRRIDPPMGMIGWPYQMDEKMMQELRNRFPRRV